MSSFCTAPGNIVYLALSWIKKKCSLQHFGHCSNQYGDVICLFYLLTYLLYLLPIQEYVLVDFYKQLELGKKKKKTFTFEIFEGLSLPKWCCHSNDTESVTKKKKKKTSRLLWSRWMTATDGCRRKINGYVNEKWGIKGVVQSIYDNTKAYCHYQRAQAVQNSSYIMCREQCPISAGLLDKHIANERESIYTCFCQ